MNDWNESVKERLIHIAENHGIRYNHIAKTTKIPAQTLSSWKHGRFNFKEDKLKRLEEFIETYSN